MCPVARYLRWRGVADVCLIGLSTKFTLRPCSGRMPAPVLLLLPMPPQERWRHRCAALCDLDLWLRLDFSLPPCFPSPFFSVFCLLPVSLCLRFPLRARPCSRCHGFRRLVYFGCLLDGCPSDVVVFVTADAWCVGSNVLVDDYTMTVNPGSYQVLMRFAAICASHSTHGRMSSFRGLIVVSQGMASAFAVWGWNGTTSPVCAPL